MYRVLICDDEPIMRRGLAAFVDWAGLGCELVGEAADGLEGRALADQLGPDIVIAYIQMPGLTGLELAESLRKSHPRTLVILLTAHSEFRYAQKAVSLDIVDYLLKTEATEAVPEAVRKALGRLREASARGAGDREQALFRLVAGGFEDSLQAPDLLRGLGVDLTSFRIVAASGPDFPDFPCLRSDLCFRPNLRLSGWIVPETGGPGPWREFGGPGILGVSHRHSGWKALPKAWAEAPHALIAGFYDPAAPFRVGAPPPGSLPGAEAIGEVVEGYRRALLGQDIPAAAALVRGVAEKCAAARLEPDRFRSLILLFHTLGLGIGRRLPAAGEEGPRALLEALEGSSAPQLLTDLDQFLTELFAGLDERRVIANQVIARVDTFVDEHLHENLSLEDLAKEVFLSPSYLSRLYAAETGQNLKTAIILKKVAKAKHILETTQLKASVVGVMIGIDDPTYFSYFFKKYAGTTPSEYRASRRSP